MGTKEKLINELKKRPKNFTYSDAESILLYLGFERSNKGHTSGSRIMFTSESHGNILLHKPHPQNNLKHYQIKLLADYLEQEGLI